jgi:O-antigen ligase
VAALAALLLAGPEIRERFVSTTQYAHDETAQLRFDSWDAGAAMAWEDPLTGKGIRNSNAFAENYGADRINRTIHNQYLQLAADSGIPSMLTFVALMGVAGWRFFRTRHRCYPLIAGPSGPDPDTRSRRIPYAAPRLDEVDRVELRQMASLFLAGEAALVIFAAGGMFLSLELFEIVWMLFVAGSVAPRVMDQDLFPSPAGRVVDVDPHATPVSPPRRDAHRTPRAAFPRRRRPSLT